MNASTPATHNVPPPPMAGFWRRCLTWLTGAHGVRNVTLLAVLLMLPTLNVGMLGDDFLFRDILNGYTVVPHPGSLFGLYTFSSGDAGFNHLVKSQGLIPWWVADNARMMFWRPLSELTHALDHALWPQHPALMHLHTIAWYGLLVWLLARFYRQLDPHPTRAHFGAMVFAVATPHLLTVIWLAARNQLIAACLILLTLMAHHQWRQRGKAWWGVASALCFALALSAAEAGIAAAAYVVAYAWFMDRERPVVSRIWSVVPYALIAVVWHHAYQAWGYGSAGLGGYIDPGQDPGRFVYALLLRLPSLLLAALLGVTSTTLQTFPVAFKPAYAAVALALLAMLWWQGRRIGLWRSPTLCFLAGGAVLALVPVCAAETNDRLLLNAELGLSAVVGTVLARLFTVNPDTWRQAGQVAARRWAMVLAGVHLVLFPVLTLLTTLTVGQVIAVAAHDEPLSLPDVPTASGRHLILLNPPKALFVGYFPASRRAHGLESGASLQALASGDQPLKLKVVDPYTIEMQASKGFGDEVSRDLVMHPFLAHESHDAGAFVATVLHVNASGRADEVRFRFKYRLDDPTLAFYSWTDQGYRPYTMPMAEGAERAFQPGSVTPMVRRRFGLR